MDTLQVALNEVGDRKVDQTIQTFQNGKILPLMIWNAAYDNIEIIYDNYSDGAWRGIVWSGGTETVGDQLLFFSIVLAF